MDWDGVQREDSVDAGDTCSGLELLKCSDRNQIYARSSKSSSAPFILDYCRGFLRYSEARVLFRARSL